LEKRLPLAIFLSFLVFFTWTVFFAKPVPEPVGAPAVPGAAPGAGEGETSAEVARAAAPAIADDVERELELWIGSPGSGRRGTYRALFSNRGARLLELDLGDFVRHAGQSPEDRANWLPLVESVEAASAAGQPAGRTGSLVWRTSASSNELAPGGLEGVLWEMEELGGEHPGVLFRYSPAGGAVVFEKRVTFEPGTWHLRLELALENVAAGSPGRRDFVLVPAACVPAELGDSFYAEPRAVAVGRGRSDGDFELDYVAAPKLDEPGTLDVPVPLALVGQHNKYFAFVLSELDAGGTTLQGAAYAPVRESGLGGRELLRVEVPLALALPAPGERRGWQYSIYAGPKAPGEFEEGDPAHELLLDEDLSFAFIARALLSVLRFFHGWVKNWGFAIILLTLCVRLALFPLNRRAQTAMARYQKRMKRVQPKLEELKARYAADPQKLREAQARLMQEEGAFPPLGGCLPIFLQMPIFFGLFSALRTSFDLRQAPFLGWVHDLSQPDRLLELNLRLPFLPDVRYLNLFPILMVVLWLLQQLGMPKPADEQAARMQKMMMFMPIVFGLFLYNYAAGLSLYMMTTSAASIVEQRVIKKLWPLDERELPRREKAGCGPFAGMMQHLAEKQREQMKRMQAMQQQPKRRKR
jgi:YidC/Oxa1 family membrane protein insertase